VFTGLIIETGAVEELRQLPGITRLSIKTPTIHKEASIGDSIAINGVCLTVVGIAGSILAFELSGETMKSTNMGRLDKGDKVNLEPSLAANGKLGGHFVTGHVDAIGKILSKKRSGETIEIEIQAPPEILSFLVDKGSVAIDGISLTVVKVKDNSFTLVIIPHTEKITNLGDRRTGDIINIETDIIGKYVKKFMPSPDRGSTIMSTLRESGFLDQ